MWIHDRVQDGMILYFHHPCRKFKSWDGLFKVRWNAVNVSYHDGLTISTDWISKEICQSCLSIWNMISLVIRKSKYNLFKVRETLVDMSSFIELSSWSTSFLRSLRSCKIYQMKFWVHNLLCWFYSWSWFNMESVNTVRPRWMRIKLMSSIGSV